MRWPGGEACEPWMRTLKLKSPFEVRLEQGDPAPTSIELRHRDGPWFRVYLLGVARQGNRAVGLRYTYDPHDSTAPHFAMPFDRCRPMKAADAAPAPSRPVPTRPMLDLSALPELDAAFEESLEAEYWYWDAEGARTGAPRDAFKMAMRGAIRAAYMRGRGATPTEPAKDAAPVQDRPGLAKCPEWTRELGKGSPMLAGPDDAVVIFDSFWYVDGTPVGLCFMVPEEVPSGSTSPPVHYQPFEFFAPYPKSVATKLVAPDPRDAEISKLRRQLQEADPRDAEIAKLKRRIDALESTLRAVNKLAEDAL
jgi:hypothetical protein